jgi:hypothetical protein
MSEGSYWSDMETHESPIFSTIYIVLTLELGDHVIDPNAYPNFVCHRGWCQCLVEDLSKNFGKWEILCEVMYSISLGFGHLGRDGRRGSMSHQKIRTYPWENPISM